MATEQITAKEASDKNMVTHTTPETVKSYKCQVCGNYKATKPRCGQCVESTKKTVLYRYNESKVKADYDHNQFCGLILAEHIEASKESITKIAKLWAKSEPSFPKSDKAFDTIEEALCNHVKALASLLRSGSTKVVANLVPVTF